MTIVNNEMLWRQFSITIDSFGDALRNCPDELWEEKLWEDQTDQWVAAGFSTCWYLCYHTLFWLDLYLTGAEEGFMPPEPFDLVEMVDDEILPRVYTRDELLGYFAICRNRCQEKVINLSTEEAYRICEFPWGKVPFGELLLYTMRHVQEHAAQLHMFLGNHARNA